MTASRPARSLGQEAGVIDIPNENSARNFLLLEMAFQAERLIALVQHSLVDRAVRRMANDAAFANRFVLVNEWTALRSVTLHAGVIHTHEGDPAADDRLVQTSAAAFNRLALVRIVAI